MCNKKIFHHWTMTWGILWSLDVADLNNIFSQRWITHYMWWYNGGVLSTSSLSYFTNRERVFFVKKFHKIFFDELNHECWSYFYHDACGNVFKAKFARGNTHEISALSICLCEISNTHFFQTFLHSKANEAR